MNVQLDRRKARIAARAIQEHRRHARVSLGLSARILLETGRECPCRITDISVGGLSGEADLAPRINSRVVAVVEGLGRLEGRATRASGQRFSLVFDTMSLRKRLQLADELTWKLNADRLGLVDDRRAPRRLRPGVAHLTLADGLTTTAKYLDASDVGASFASSEHPRPGEKAKVEDRAAQVARRHASGFAVDFAPGEPRKRET